MRPIISIIVSLCLLLLPRSFVRADEARAILDRAIQAHGGEARLARTKVGRLKAKVEGANQMGTFKQTWEETFDLPRRYKRSIEGTVNGMAISMEYAVSGGKRWSRTKGETLPDSPMAPIPLEYHWQTFLAQLPLLRGKDTRLTALGEERRGDRTLVGIRAVSSQFQAELYFDKSTGLLARARRPLPNLLGMVGEELYDDYREVNGVRYPMHLRDSNGGANFTNLTIVSIEFLDKIDASEFDKPEPPPAAATDIPSVNQLDSAQEQESAPARWDIRLIIATLGVGVVVGAVWLIVRASKRRDAPTPPT